MNCRENWLPIALTIYLLLALLHPRNFAVSNYSYETLRELERQLRTSLEPNLNSTEDLKPLCPAIPEFGFNSITSIKQNRSFWSLKEVDYFDEKIVAQSLNLELGGIWSPKTCKPVHHISLIVPYRDRPSQLQKFLLYMHTFLQLQLVHYKIIVVEQKDDLPFNRGKLLNVGYKEAIKQGWYNCFIFHDVDLLPESLNNIYGCSQQPRHMSAVCNTFRYTLQYKDLFGGVISITKDVFKSINGFSNNFFGWGGEDDDLYSRIQSKKFKIIRLSPTVSSYRMLPHKKANRIEERYDQVNAAEKNHDIDGLNHLKYFITNHIASPLYTLIQVKL